MVGFSRRLRSTLFINSFDTARETRDRVSQKLLLFVLLDFVGAFSKMQFLKSAVATFEINPRAFLINISVSGARDASSSIEDHESHLLGSP